MKNSPLVSIIIPSFNYGSLINETIHSVKAQVYENWEIIIIDDGSTDNTRNVVSEFLLDPRIHYFFQENAGLSAARNLGLRKIKGEYVQFLDADDLISEDKFLLQVKQFENDNTLGISYCNTFYFEHANKDRLYKTLELTDTDWMPRLNGDKIEALNALIKNNIMPVNAALVKRSVIDAVGEFDTSLKSLEDWDYWLKCSFVSKIKYLDDELAYALVRVHKTSMSQNRLRMLFVELELRKKFDKLLLSADILTENKLSLRRKNNKNIKSQAACIIRENGFFDIQILKNIQDKIGLRLLVIAYFKSINDSRKH